jgi:hypothetical protein
VAIASQYLDNDNIELSMQFECVDPTQGIFCFRFIKTPKSHAGPASPNSKTELVSVESKRQRVDECVDEGAAILVRRLKSSGAVIWVSAKSHQSVCFSLTIFINHVLLWWQKRFG